MSELAETLRDMVDSDEAMRKARAALPEMDPYIEKLERENEAMKARVRELEWALGTPHAAGKVLAWVRGTERMDEVNSFTYKDYQSAKDMAGLGHTYKRVAAIVDIAQPAQERDA
jgi:hypothetical protein